MKFIKTFASVLLLMTYSCNNRPKTRIISRYSDGNIEETYTYKNSSDTLSYTDTKYHDNGKIWYQGDFTNNKRNGSWVWFFPNGVLSDSATYHNGDFVERRVHWDSSGVLIKLEIIKGPCYDCCCDGVVISYYPNGKKEDEANMFKGKKHGKYVYYYNNGQAKKEEYFNADVKDGKYYEWYANGVQWVTGFYKQDKMDSIWTWFDSTGKVSSIQELRKGELVRDIK